MNCLVLWRALLLYSKDVLGSNPDLVLSVWSLYVLLVFMWAIRTRWHMWTRDRIMNYWVATKHVIPGKKGVSLAGSHV